VGRRIEQRDCGTAKGPATRFAWIDEQPIEFIALDARFVRMAENGDIPIVGLTPKLPLHVADNEAGAVRGRVAHRRLSHLSDRGIA